MLYRGIRTLSVLVVLLFLISCKKELTKEEQKQFDIERMETANKKRKIYFNYSKALVGEKEYYKIYNAAKDTVINWTKNKILYTGQYEKSLILDSLICFNSNKDRCCMSLGSCHGIDKGDNVMYFYGVKIKEKWYFYGGGTVVLPRDYYQDDIHKPLSLALFKQIAIEEILGSYLIKVPLDEDSNKFTYKINERPFISMEFRNQSRGFADCYDCKTFEEFVIYTINNNWKRKIENEE